MAETRVYNRRHPERTDYYRVIESRFEELERMWPECFEHHPHVHALVPAGIMKDGVFHELKRVSLPVIAGLFRVRLLKVLLEEGVISQQIVDLLLTWNHHSGLNVHARGLIHGTDRKAIENVARYMSRAALSVERVRYNRAEDHVTVSKKPFGSSREESRSYPVGDFLALLASHIPGLNPRRTPPAWKRAPENSRLGPCLLWNLDFPVDYSFDLFISSISKLVVYKP